MNLNVYLNSLKSLINHIIKIVFFSVIFLQAVYSQQDTLLNNNSSVDSIFVMQKSPLKAVLMSAVIPGLGQIYTQSYWKVPVIWGITGWLIYEWSQSNNYYKEYGKLYNQSTNSDAQELYLNQKKIYQDQRDLFAIYIGLTYLLNIVDAYVEAQLFDFSVSKNSVTNSTMLNMRINF